MTNKFYIICNWIIMNFIFVFALALHRTKLYDKHFTRKRVLFMKSVPPNYPLHAILLLLCKSYSKQGKKLWSLHIAYMGNTSLSFQTVKGKTARSSVHIICTHCYSRFDAPQIQFRQILISRLKSNQIVCKLHFRGI